MLTSAAICFFNLPLKESGIFELSFKGKKEFRKKPADDKKKGDLPLVPGKETSKGMEGK